eukprot:TRINITY_DN104511_c0_g1_i1.p1 TRINITY_DN104511_c0_g1~~TRINITY_DN104511_c0_g1_i1.p1  ORF type:complete len:111 (+),score=7.80 TRINITY_DN104511_c0_g1_i1:274-606(+)
MKTIINKCVQKAGISLGVRHSLQYIKYKLQHGYDIEEHRDDDARKATILIYLKKSPKIKDTLFVNRQKVPGQRWKRGGIAFFNRARHSCEFQGSGEREILSVFVDSQYRL